MGQRKEGRGRVTSMAYGYMYNTMCLGACLDIWQNEHVSLETVHEMQRHGRGGRCTSHCWTGFVRSIHFLSNVSALCPRRQCMYRGIDENCALFDTDRQREWRAGTDGTPAFAGGVLLGHNLFCCFFTC